MDLESGTRKLGRIERDALLITLGGTILSVILTGSWLTMISFLLGGALMIANFHFLWKFARRLFEREEKKTAPFLAGLFLFFFLFLGAVAGSLLFLKLPLVPFFLGTMALLVSIFLNGVVFI